jgi:putative aldouronate transport system substrate-binding protein
VVPASVADPSGGLQSATAATKNADLTRIVGDGISAVVFGRSPASAWKDVVAQWRQAGGDRVADEYTASR